MDYKKIKTDITTVTRNVTDFNTETANIYKTVCILAKRSNQINQEMKKELTQKLEEFALSTDNLEEVFENREQIEIAKYYERLPKPALIAIHEFLNKQLEYREPTEDDLSKAKPVTEEEN